ncbi:MAG: CorA family divalent cation transporter [Desulfobulbia bacterium]
MEPIDGLINAFLLDGKGGGQKLNWDDIRALDPEQGRAWVRLDFTDPNAPQWLHDESGRDPIIAEALVAEETRPRCENIQGGLLLCLRGVNSNPGADRVRGEFLLKQQLDVGKDRHNTFARCNCLAEQVG